VCADPTSDGFGAGKDGSIYYWNKTVTTLSESDSILAPTNLAVVARIPVVVALHFNETVVELTVQVHTVVTPADPVAIKDDTDGTELVAVTTPPLFTALKLNSS
jgi:hypothetical protein